jgi:hypothetical protein
MPPSPPSTRPASRPDRWWVVTVRLLFEPCDLWVGIYWRRLRLYQPPRHQWDIYVCLIPTLPVRVRWFVGAAS